MVPGSRTPFATPLLFLVLQSCVDCVDGWVRNQRLIVDPEIVNQEFCKEDPTDSKRELRNNIYIYITMPSSTSGCLFNAKDKKFCVCVWKGHDLQCTPIEGLFQAAPHSRKPSRQVVALLLQQGHLPIRYQKLRWCNHLTIHWEFCVVNIWSYFYWLLSLSRWNI